MKSQRRWTKYFAVLMFTATAIITGCGGGGSSSTASNNANLSKLIMSAGEFDQAFQSSQPDYTATVNFLTASTTVTPTTADTSATVTVNGTAVVSGTASESIPLDAGDTLITVIVTAADDHSTQTYTITVTRESANEFAQQAYIKASNTDQSDNFGYSVALSGDTLAVGAVGEDSKATGIGGNEDDNSLNDTGAVYVFTRSDSQWSLQAYVKASNTNNSDLFGTSVALSGNTLAIGAIGEDSKATGIDGNEDDNSLNDAGAVYVFTRSDSQWSQQAYIKASNTDQSDNFGYSVALSGNTLAVGASGENSNATGVDGDEDDNSLNDAGAVYVFIRSGTQWSQQAYVKSSNTDQSDNFGYSVALSGETLAVGASGENSNATGIDGNEDDNSLNDAGAVYVFTRSDSLWSQQAYVKASSTNNSDLFGTSVALSGNTLAVGASGEDSNASGVDGNEDDNSLNDAGAVYVFTRSDSLWSQQAYVKASNTDDSDLFGSSVALSDDTMVVGASGENSNATGIDGNEDDNSLNDAGAVYVFTRSDSLWSQQAYVKASNTDDSDLFGSSVALSGDTLAVGASGENSKATGIDGDQSDNSLNNAGATYTFQ